MSIDDKISAVSMAMALIAVLMTYIAVRMLDKVEDRLTSLNERAMSFDAEVERANRVYAEFVELWNYGARDEAADVIRNYIAACNEARIKADEVAS